MTNLTFYGGVNEIGGNKVLLEDRGVRLFLDFGQSFIFGERFFVEWLTARERFGLRDYFALNLVPKIKGLYSKEVLQSTDFEYSEPEFHGVFLSHIHFDHLGHIRFLDEGIPLYLGATTKRMLDSWEMTGRQGFGEHDYRTFRTGDKIKIDSIEIEPIHVDHSAPAAYGFIIHTSDKTLAYTGDLRLHGTHAKLSRDFVEKVKNEKPDIMICEGTRVAPADKRENLSEQGVFDRSDRIIANTKKLVTTCFYGRDIDRMKTFHKLAEKSGRKFVVSTKTAHLLKCLVDDPRIEVPDPTNDENMLIYARKMDRRDKWEKEFLDLDASVDAEYVRSHQSELILHMNFTHFAELIDIKPERGSIFIHSMSEPFEEDDIEDEVKHNWLEYFGLDYHQAHASGHCAKDEIFNVVKEINPKKIFPVHTEHPELFVSEFGNIVEPPMLNRRLDC
ncbi:MAG: MBL fold metallo-hydrolase [Thermoplasmata archaeon]